MGVAVPAALIERYNQPGPRYTSYPTVPVWSGGFGAEDYEAAIADLAGRADDELSIYAHFPFCADICHYCGCNAIAPKREGVVDSYLDHLETEIRRVAAGLGGRRRVVQLHWGGGTPNFLDAAQLERAYGLFAGAFDLDPRGEISLEIDPRLATAEQIALLRRLGFNRISLGVQDFDAGVQANIGRLQPEEQSRAVYELCREAGFASVNLDLVYGLPGQSGEIFERTIGEIVGLRPDRVALYSYAHLPRIRPNQKLVDESLLPSADDKFALFLRAIDRFAAGGFEWVGMDHFALPTDELSVAQRERRLHRNFMGYTVRPAQHMLAFGASAIGDLADRFVQNEVKLGRYQKGIAAGSLPVLRGHRLSDDDRLRRRVITHLICNLELPFALTTAEFGEPVDALLPEAVERLRRYTLDGFVQLQPGGLTVTELGRFFIRNLCMELDAYLPGQKDRPVFSKTI